MTASWREEDAFHRFSIGSGSKGGRSEDWAVVPLRRLVLKPAPWKHGLLIRRDREGELSCYVVFAPLHATLEEVARVAGARWSIE